MKTVTLSSQPVPTALFNNVALPFPEAPVEVPQRPQLKVVYTRKAPTPQPETITKPTVDCAWPKTTFVQDVSNAIRTLIEAGSFSASKLATHLGLTQKALTAAVFRVTGDGISALAMQVRLEIAHELLTSTNLPIDTVRECAGIRSKAYFSDMFKEKFGVTPREFCMSKQR
ncbi:MULTISPECIES: AraC family transcriptional regulator [unclassified Flavobacterium]|uniref:helix-turn-helix domain-containing protein n=1 Tax=unclassified Flavobacterium TaxID=196869 RepID=UPI001F12A328|nr:MULTISPECIES: helix-turn-helix transcriptional regulator [unclassified Flavobacterium]UMY66865.1 helix-turn-helix transcriptional regulator [Flavobacterium sp. HJ-32-4]